MEASRRLGVGAQGITAGGGEPRGRLARGWTAALAAACVLAAAGAIGCADIDPDALPGDEMDNVDEATTADAISARTVFVRSDQVHLGRAPANTQDLHELVADDFANPAQTASAVLARLADRPMDRRPVYLGNVHSWVFNASGAYRANIAALARAVDAGTGRRVILYFEEDNATHRGVQVSHGLAGALRAVTQHATLLVATYCSGRMTEADVRARARYFRNYYYGVMGVPLARMMLDVDTSQTPSSFYYGSRGNLAQFNRVIGWTLDASYDLGFAGFHTMGNVTANYGTEVAADSTYRALDAAWAALEAAHPRMTFEGVR